MHLWTHHNCVPRGIAHKYTHTHIHIYIIHVSHISDGSFHQMLVEVHDPQNVEEPLPQSCLRGILPTLLRVACVDTFFSRFPSFKPKCQFLALCICVAPSLIVIKARMSLVVASSLCRKGAFRTNTARKPSFPQDGQAPSHPQRGRGSPGGDFLKPQAPGTRSCPSQYLGHNPFWLSCPPHD